MFTRHDREMFEIFHDPVKWVAHHLGEAPRWYQAQILRHPHHRKVLRCGRRVGKCIAGDQRVLNPDTGSYLTVQELFESQQPFSVVTLDEKYKGVKGTGIHVSDNGVKEVFKVKTKQGHEVVLTGNHPVLTVDGWREVDLVRPGMRIATPMSLPFFGNEVLPESHIKALAYMYAGGNINEDYVTFSCKFADVAYDFQQTMTKVGCKAARILSKETTHVVKGADAEGNPLLDLFESYGVFEKEGLPQIIFQLEKEQLRLFLKTFFSVSGWIHAGKRCEIGVSNVSKQLMRDIGHLLLRLGVWSRFIEKKQTISGVEYVSYHLLMLRRDDMLMFMKEIGMNHRKEEAMNLMKHLADLDTMEHTIPKEVWSYMEETRKEKGLKKKDVVGQGARVRTQIGPSRNKMKLYANNLQDHYLWDLAHSDVIWEEVDSIESQGEQQTYDISVPETHNLVVEDVYVHNTWTMTAHMLWVAFTCNGGTELKKGATCLVATPYDTQAREIFDQLNNFINSNPVLKDSVESIRRSPYEIVLKNKSRIKLYTAGTRSGSEGGSMRGQKASWLYMDEVDYLSDKDFEAIYAITLEAPQRIGIMCASTPTGRRGTFYNICKNPNMKISQDVPLIDKEKAIFDTRPYDRTTVKGWQEFHFPTMVNPEWDEGMEQELKALYSEMAYEHEVLAEFGTEMAGVFNKDYVDEATSSGYHLLSRPIYDSPITIGIDWDKFGAATQIVVTQWDPFESRRDGQVGEGRFKVINRIEIPKSEFTYDNAVQKIIELDRIYNPAFIYPDRGAGEYQIEMLRKALGDKVKGVHLGSSHMVRDPHSREFDKKPIKPFMVNQTVMLLERGMLRIPTQEMDETIYRQMVNYQVVSISAKTGEPTYSNKDEHALDAFMLSLLAFIIEMPNIAQTVDSVKGATTFGSANMKFIDPLAQLKSFRNTDDVEWDEPGSPPLKKVPTGSRRRGSSFSWGSRGTTREFTRRKF
ncbi:phage terminase large subunit family protein_gp116 [Bacillus phage vB_BceM_WH1]|nr:phage terminase large subunit family protein_gp116 [Bacillus phage vB_BceM_WH1]